MNQARIAWPAAAASDALRQQLRIGLPLASEGVGQLMGTARPRR